MYVILFNDISQSSLHPKSNRQQNTIFPTQGIFETDSGAEKEKKIKYKVVFFLGIMYFLRI